MFRNYLVGKVASGANNALVASSSAPAPKGVASASVSTLGTEKGRNRLYFLVT